jgi:hypothetical protein
MMRHGHPGGNSSHGVANNKEREALVKTRRRAPVRLRVNSEVPGAVARRSVENSRHLPKGVPNNSEVPDAVATGTSENSMAVMRWLHLAH